MDTDRMEQTRQLQRASAVMSDMEAHSRAQAEALRKQRGFIEQPARQLRAAEEELRAASNNGSRTSSLRSQGIPTKAPAGGKLSAAELRAEYHCLTWFEHILATEERPSVCKSEGQLLGTWETVHLQAVPEAEATERLSIVIVLLDLGDVVLTWKAAEANLRT